MTHQDNIIVSDMMNERVVINFPPKKIISLVPSQSELLWDIGLQKELIGITKFCIHPTAMFRNVQVVGGTKKLNINKIIALQPDLIIGNKEENSKEDITELKEHFPVWISEIETLGDAFKMILELGRITDRKEKAERIVSEIQEEKLSFSSKYNTGAPIRCAYFIWKEPYMSVGKNNFINTLLHTCGLINVFAEDYYSTDDFENKNLRYPQINESQLKKAKPQLILLSSEPYPFREKHVREIKSIYPDTVVKIVDGEFFSWYGSRLKKSFKYFYELLNDGEIRKLRDRF